jgi:hypothetical protein
LQTRPCALLEIAEILIIKPDRPVASENRSARRISADNRRQAAEQRVEERRVFPSILFVRGFLMDLAAISGMSAVKRTGDQTLMSGSVYNSRCSSVGLKSSWSSPQVQTCPPGRDARPNARTILVSGVFSSRFQALSGLFGFIHTLGQEYRSITLMACSSSALTGVGMPYNWPNSTSLPAKISTSVARPASTSCNREVLPWG